MYAGCANCESPHISHYEHYGPTGVSLDGFHEYRTEIGVRCLECGAIEDAPALIPESHPTTLEELLAIVAEAPVGTPPAIQIEYAREAA